MKALHSPSLLTGRGYSGPWLPVPGMEAMLGTVARLGCRAWDEGLLKTAQTRLASMMTTSILQLPASENLHDAIKHLSMQGAMMWNISDFVFDHWESSSLPLSFRGVAANSTPDTPDRTTDGTFQ